MFKSGDKVRLKHRWFEYPAGQVFTFHSYYYSGDKSLSQFKELVKDLPYHNCWTVYLELVRPLRNLPDWF